MKQIVIASLANRQEKLWNDDNDCAKDLTPLNEVVDDNHYRSRIRRKQLDVCRPTKNNKKKKEEMISANVDQALRSQYETALVILTFTHILLSE